jgi:hypothetical protein
LNSNSELQQRISMILNTRRNSSPRLAKAKLASLVSATALIAVLALYSGPRLVLGQTAATPPTPVVAASAGGAIAGTAAVVSTQEAIRAVPEATVTFAQADEPRAATPSVHSGPKFKPATASETPPEAPEPPEMGVAPNAVPPELARVAKAARAPRPPRTPEAAGDSDDSIEKRLQRLEKMVRSLVADQNPKRLHGNLYLKDGADQELRVNQHEIEMLRESADRQAARAVEQAKRAAEQANRASRDFQNSARMEQEMQGQGAFKESFQKQIEALRNARESLGHEMERLDHQIDKLEKELKRGEKDQQRRSEAPQERLQAQVAPTPEVAE